MGRSQRLPRPGGGGSGRADDTGCTVLHVDMDAFYASVEVRRRPELRGRPVVVGGVGPRGVVSSASYPAREHGVRSAMPMARALRLCPDAVVIPPDIGAYAEVSRSVMALLRSVTPLVEPLSLDEAFLDVAGALRRLGPPAAIAEAIRRDVLDQHGLTCSVGVAPTKFVAKLASTLCKPDGMLVVPADGVLEFLHPLPVAALWGVGERTEERLSRLGLRTVGDVAAAPVAALRHALGRAAAEHLHALSWGRDPRRVVPDEPDRSIGAEETFEIDVEDPEVVGRELLRLAERTAARLRAGGHLARTVSIKVRFADFTTVTRSRTLARPTDAGRHLYQTAAALYASLRLDRARIRLVGVRAEGLTPAGAVAEQLQIGEPERGWRDADRAVDEAARRFGAGVVRPARLMPPHTGDGSRRQPPGGSGTPAAAPPPGR